MRHFSESIKAYILLFIIIILIFFSKSAKAGATRGINLCENIIIPSLLPIMILSNTIIKIKRGNAVTSAVLFGMISGYPSGAVLTRELYKSGCITSKEAQRIMSYNFCGGLAFIISAVGSIIYKSTTAGIILFVSCVLPSLIIALCTKPFYKGESKSKAHLPKTDFSSALCESVESSVKSLALMSAYIILFSALIGVVSVPDYITPLLEITNGICRAKTLPPLPFCAFFLSFGGLCIHLQLFSFLKEMKVGYSHFFIFRLLSASLSFFICRLILHFSGDSALVSATLSPALPFELSKLGGGLSMVLIIGCAVIVFDIENRKLQLNK